MGRPSLRAAFGSLRLRLAVGIALVMSAGGIVELLVVQGGLASAAERTATAQAEGDAARFAVALGDVRALGPARLRARLAAIPRGRVISAAVRRDGALIVGLGSIAVGVPDHGARRSALRTYGKARPGVAVPNGTDVRIVRLRLPHGTLIVAVRDSDAAVSTQVRRLIVAGAWVNGLIAILLTLALWRAVFRPVGQLRGAFERLRTGAAGTRLGWRRRDELGTLARDFDAMAADLEQTHRRLEGLALRDPLTDLLNHRSFHQELRERVQAGGAVALIALDLDHFKAINDAHGHPYGDEVLRSTAEALTVCLRDGDVVARIGGEEFAVILADADAAVAAEAADRIRAAIGTLILRDGRRLSASAGVATLPHDAADADELLKHADAALYAAKRGGRDQTRRYEPADADSGTVERGEVEALLADPERLQIVVQPWVDLATGRIAGYEALARFPGTGRGPEAWFAQAQRCGLGPELEAAAMRRALAVAAPPPGTFLSVNLSPSSLSLASVMADFPEDARHLVLEVTEHEALVKTAALEQALSDIRRRGARIAVDDAGAGYAGLTSLMRLRPDVIKLDRSVISSLDDDPAKVAMVESLVRFARRTGAAVCAEGIETLDELALLADLDVTYGQGYVLARPAPPWPAVPEALSASLAERGTRPASDAADAVAPQAADARLERICARLAAVKGGDGLAAALSLIATELRSDEVAFSSWNSQRRVVRTMSVTGGWELPGQQIEYDLRRFPLGERVLLEGMSAQVSVSDPLADAAEVELLRDSGLESLLILPVGIGGTTLGLLEVGRRNERAFSRSETDRARIVAYQLGAVLAAGRAGHLPEAPVLRYRGSRRLASA
jgi:diguanylate cyclase (GGDEF)-like protein